MTEEATAAVTEIEAVDPAVTAAATGDEPPKVEDAPEPKAAETIATGAEEKAEPETAPYWPEDWRQKAAEHVAAGDEKVYKKELKRLERMADPAGVYAFAREMEAKFDRGGLLKVPGENAKEEEIAEFNKALGVPEDKDGYTKDIQLENGAVIGDLDKPVVDYFAEQALKDGMTPKAFNGLVNAYYARQEEEAAALDEMDETFRNESRQTLKEEYGNAFQRYTTSVSSLFATAPGGADVEAEGSLYGRLMGGRMADGKMIGDDPDMVRFLVGLSREINPIATVTEGGEQTGMGIEAELEKLSELRKTDPKKYYSNEIQARELELIAAREKHRARA